MSAKKDSATCIKCGMKVVWYQGDPAERICFCGKKHRWENPGLEKKEETKDDD